MGRALTGARRTAGLILCGASIAAAAQQSSAIRPLVDRDHRRMQAEAAEQFVAGNTIYVAGDPSRPGIYVIRRLFKPGETSSPHYHDQDRYVTVIKGTWWTGEGDVKRPEQMVPIAQGGFMLHPAGLHHYDGSSEGDVIVQIVGMGPVKTVDIDSQGRPTGTR